MISKFFNYVQNDIWRVRLHNYPPTKSFLIRQLRVFVLSIRGFIENQCKFRASALTFFTLFSIVPILAMIFGIAKGFGLDKRVQEEILNKFQGQEEMANKIISFTDSLLANANGGLIAGIGVIMIFWSIISMLGNIESSFNDIWGVKKARSFGRKATDYLIIMLLCPVLLVMAGSITVLISAEIQHFADKLPILKTYGEIIVIVLKLLSFLAIWTTFTFIFIFMPNTKVKFTSGLVAGIITGTIFQIVQWAYIKFQIGVANYSAVYGSFAALPLFLLWMQTSWWVLLFGAELSFAHQNVDTYEFEPDCLLVSYSFKMMLTLLITQSIVRSFCNDEKPMTSTEISHKLDIPIRLVREILYELVEARIISEVRQGDRELVYQPAKDVEKLSIKHVIDSIEKRGNTNIPVIRSAEYDKLSTCLQLLADTIKVSPANMLLKNI